MFFGLVFVICQIWAMTLVVNIAISVFGRPRGVGYGILLEFLTTVFTLHGALMVIWFRLFPLKLALFLSLVIILAVTVRLIPTHGERPVLSLCATAMISCLAFAFWHPRRRVRL